MDAKKLSELKSVTELLIKDAEGKIKTLNTLNISHKKRLDTFKEKEKVLNDRTNELKRRTEELAQKENDLKVARLRLLKLVNENKLDRRVQQLMVEELRKAGA